MDDEQNTLTLEQVTDVINGMTVLGPPRSIREAQGAYQAYGRVFALNSYSGKTPRFAHKAMMGRLVK